MIHSFPGADDIFRVTLPNGITLLSRANFNSAAVVFSGYLHAGSLFDPDAQLGLADFTAAALMRGTDRRSFQELYDALESAGASLRFSGGNHTTAFSGQALVEDIGMLLELLAEVLRRPSFPASEVQRLRSQLLTGLALRAQDTASMAQLTFDQLIYADHPYARPEDGFPETIQSIGDLDLAAFHRLHYGPRGMVIAIVGGLEPQRAIDRAAQVLQDWGNPAQPVPPNLPPVKALPALTRRQVTIPGKSQADLVLGAAGPPRRSPDYVPANLGNSILGQFGMAGRIGEVVREQAGLAYSIQSSLGGGMGPGPWDISAGVDPGDVERTIELIRAELRRFVEQPVSKEELADTQAYFVGSLPLSLESNFGVASALLNLERYQLGLDYYREYAGMINSVKEGDILQVARRYLDPDRLGIASAGPGVG